MGNPATELIGSFWNTVPSETPIMNGNVHGNQVVLSRVLSSLQRTDHKDLAEHEFPGKRFPAAQRDSVPTTLEKEDSKHSSESCKTLVVQP